MLDIGALCSHAEMGEEEILAVIECNTQSMVWLGHLKSEIPMRHRRGHVKHVIGDEVRLGDIKLECTSV